MPRVEVYFDDDSLALVRRAARHDGMSPFIRRTVLNELERHRPKPHVEILSRNDIRAEILSILADNFPERFPVRETASPIESEATPA